MKIILVIGYARSGKDTAAKFIEKKLNYRHFDYTRDVSTKKVVEAGLRPSKENIAKFVVERKLKEGQDVWAKDLWKLIEESNEKKIVVTGTRSPEEVAFFKSKNPSLKIIAVKAGEEKRFERAKKEKFKSLNEFLERDKHDIKGSGMDKVIALADKLIENNSSLKELYKKIQELDFLRES